MLLRGSRFHARVSRLSSDGNHGSSVSGATSATSSATIQPTTAQPVKANTVVDALVDAVGTGNQGIRE